MKRDHDLDILKGVAVIAMSFVHVNIFFLDQQALVLDKITKWGAISCFTAFLLIVGIIEGRLIKKEKTPKWSKILKRILFLYISYLVIALLSLYQSTGRLEISELLNILIFKNPPLLSEYLIPFILISFIYKVGYKQLKEISKSWQLTFIISLGVFLLGTLMYRSNVLDGFWIKDLLVGNSKYHYFPLLQYLPIYLLGLFLGRKDRIKYFILSFILAISTYLLFKTLKLDIWIRFPPNLYFLVESLLLPLLILVVLKGFDINIKFLPLEIYAKDSLLSLVILTVTTLLLVIFFSPLFPVIGVWVLNLTVIALTGLILTIYLKMKKMV
jgi:uncharacterized membrane protein